MPEKPNILVVMTDQLSPELMSYLWGKQIPETLNVDYLAEQSVIFTNAYCANQLCIPSRSFIST